MLDADAIAAASPEVDEQEPEDAPAEITEEFVEVTSVEVADELIDDVTDEVTQEEEGLAHIENGNGHNSPLTIEQLTQLPINKVRALAKTKEVSSAGKRYEIAQRLDGQVTQADVDALN